MLWVDTACFLSQNIVKVTSGSASYLSTSHQSGNSTLVYAFTSLNPVPNAQVCVYLTVHITKLQLQTTFPKPLYIPHSACIHQDPGH